jgi:hypothetical protein
VREHRAHLIEYTIDPCLAGLHGCPAIGDRSAIVTLYSQTQLVILNPAPVRFGIVPEMALAEDNLTSVLTQDLRHTARNLEVAAELQRR